MTKRRQVRREKRTEERHTFQRASSADTYRFGARAPDQNDVLILVESVRVNMMVRKLDISKPKDEWRFATS